MNLFNQSDRAPELRITNKSELMSRFNKMHVGYVNAYNALSLQLPPEQVVQAAPAPQPAETQEYIKRTKDYWDATVEQAIQQSQMPAYVPPETATPQWTPMPESEMADAARATLNGLFDDELTQ